MYVVVGANGFLGSYIIKSIMEHTEEQILAVCRDSSAAFFRDQRIRWMDADIEHEEDVERITSAMEDSTTPCKVAYLAACHHPDVVERDPKSAWHTNITCLSSFLERTSNMACLYYPSTDTVYGEGNPTIRFSEEADLSPVNTYGMQKATAEAVVRGFGCNVVRYPFLIAPSLLPHKKHFYDYIVDSLNSGKPMEMFADSVRSSLDFSTAAELLVELMEKHRPDFPKIMNLSGDDALSKYDVGLMIAKKHGFDPSLVVPISADKTDGIFVARRAKATLLDNTKVKSILDLPEIHLKL